MSSALAPTSLKLVYFNGRGRGEITRLLFKAGGIAFEDVRLTGEEFAALKPTLPAGQLPVLEINGEYFNQSKAIEQYAARKAGLYPSDTEAALIVDIVRETIADAGALTGPIIYGPEDKRAEAKAKFLDTQLPAFLARLEGLLVKAGGVYFTGVGLSYADIAAFNFLDTVEGIQAGSTASAPALAALKARVAAVPNIAAYLATRP